MAFIFFGETKTKIQKNKTQTWQVVKPVMIPFVETDAS